MLLRYRFSWLPLSATVVTTLWLAGCVQPTPEPAKPQGKSNAAMVAAIQAAGANENSVIDVHGLPDPGITALQEGAKNDERNGLYEAAAKQLDQALQMSPQSPDLMQDRAEVAIYQGHYDAAEKLARASWSLGPRFGPLCARNMETVVELRTQASDQAGADAARKSLVECHRAGIQRF